MSKQIAIELLSESIIYNPNTGEMIWRKRPAHHFSGKRISAEKLAKFVNDKYAGTPALNYLGDDGRLHGRLGGVMIRAHVAAYALHYGRWPSGEIDHKNGNPSDNRIKNLRDVRHIENMKNRKVPSNNKSGVMGVGWCSFSKKWRSTITSNGRRICLGRYHCFGQALFARRKAERKLQFHPNHNRKRSFA